MGSQYCIANMFVVSTFVAADIGCVACLPAENSNFWASQAAIPQHHRTRTLSFNPTDHNTAK